MKLHGTRPSSMGPGLRLEPGGRPGALPLVLLFQRLVSGRRNGAWLTARLVVGYLTVWSTFGAFAHIGDLALHTALARSHWIEDRVWILSGATIALAGVYRFTPLKYFCLQKCRSPFNFMAEHWHGQKPVLDAFRLGAHHGIFCVGCCWSLMLLMFAIGIGNAAWMMGLSIVMSVEKNLPWGHRLSKPIGLLLANAGSYRRMRS